MIIFINGSINSGKSTVSKLLAKKLKAALIEVDNLRSFIEWMPIEEAIPINLENTVNIIKVFTKKGISSIIPYPLDREDYDYLMDELKGYKKDIYVFTLSPKMEIALKNRGTRELGKWEKERIKYHYEIGISNPDFGIIIDNSEEVPEETANKILKEIFIKSGG